jgi:hypothetical protein
MTFETCNILIGIAAYTIVVLVCLSLWMTCPGAGVDSIIVRISMTVGANCPFSLVSTGIDREIQSIMVESSRGPCTGRVARFTGCRELCRYMIRIGCLIINCSMAAKT